MTHKQQRRLAGLLITIAIIAAVFVIAPQQLPVTLVKVSLATIAGLTGFWLDRIVFPYAEPDDIKARAEKETDEEVRIALIESFDKAALRRAIVIAAVVIGICLGL
jgi:hypothetical protein